LVTALTLLALTPARAIELPSSTVSPTKQEKGETIIPKGTSPGEGDEQLDSMKLLAPGIGCVQRCLVDQCDDRTIFWTSDNGAHWRNITPPLTNKSSLDAFFFLDARRGWAVLEQPQKESTRAPTKLRLAIAMTDNAGGTWSETSLTLLLTNYFSKEEIFTLFDLSVREIAFADPLHGWLTLSFWMFPHVHGSFLLITSDGGRTWKDADSFPSPNLGDMILVTPTEGWISGLIDPESAQNSLFVTRNGAKSWQELSVRPVNTELWQGGMLLPSGGKLNAQGASCDVSGVPMFSDSAHGFLQKDCSEGGNFGDQDLMHTTVLFATVDGGRTWKSDRRIRNFLGSCNSSTVADSVWLAPIKRNGHLALLHVEAGADVDAGADNGSMSRYSLCSTQLSFISSSQGWMLKDGSIIQFTADGGRTWKTIWPTAK